MKRILLRAALSAACSGELRYGRRRVPNPTRVRSLCAPASDVKNRQASESRSRASHREWARATTLRRLAARIFTQHRSRSRCSRRSPSFAQRIAGCFGRRLYLDSGTLTPVLRRLERLGYVERRRSTVDERTVRVRLTSEGVGLENDMDALRESITLNLKTGLDGSAFEVLRDQLRALRGQLTEIVPAPSEISTTLSEV